MRRIHHAMMLIICTFDYHMPFFTKLYSIFNAVHYMIGFHSELDCYWSFSFLLANATESCHCLAHVYVLGVPEQVWLLSSWPVKRKGNRPAYSNWFACVSSS
eukprot:m.171682 g.171682  ORF g.171682 m.171682 type:complete len:102 (-) comp16505_c1_seq1:416-721(-)